MPGSSNWVVASGATNGLVGGLIQVGMVDMADIKPCTTLTLDRNIAEGNYERIKDDGECQYRDTSELRYIYMY